MIGAGFVLANVVRTAVIFASTPRQLPASAAALNESSIGVGARMGALLVILVRQQAAIDPVQSDLFWLRVALVVAVVVAVIGGIVVTLLLGRRDPLHSVFDLREERAEQGASG